MSERSKKSQWAASVPANRENNRISRFLKGLGKLKQSHGDERFILVLAVIGIPALSELHGPELAQHVLKRHFDRITSALRQCDQYSILNDGQCGVVFHARDADQAMTFAMRISAMACRSISVSGQDFTLDCASILVTALPRSSDALEILNFATRHIKVTRPTAGALLRVPYDSKRNLNECPDTMQMIARGDIKAYFQPKICCHTGAISGFEALARVIDDHDRVVSPAQFMPAMNETDSALITAQMLRQSLEALQNWDSLGWSVPTVAVNAAAGDLSDPNFTDVVLWELDRLDLAPARLAIEVLEEITPDATNAASHLNLRRLAKAGCRIDLDDFGTGSATLDCIRQFNPARLKIDRSFVHGSTEDPERQKMIIAILALADHLEIETIAEGVETIEEHYFLAQIGCHEVQGFAIAPPMPFQDTITFLKGHAARQTQLPQLQTRAG